MTEFQIVFRSDAQTASTDIAADTPEQALSLARELYGKRQFLLVFEPYTDVAINEIVVLDSEGEEVAGWLDDELKLRLSAEDMFEALQQAVRALNTAPRFKVPGYKDSYQVAAVCSRAIAKAKGGAS